MELITWNLVQKTPNSLVYTNQPIPTQSDKRRRKFAGLFTKGRQRFKINLGLVRYEKEKLNQTHNARKSLWIRKHLRNADMEAIIEGWDSFI